MFTEAVRKCFEVKKRNGEEAHLVQDSAIMKATADWLRYAPARVKKNVSFRYFLLLHVYYI